MTEGSVAPDQAASPSVEGRASPVRRLWRASALATLVAAPAVVYVGLSVLSAHLLTRASQKPSEISPEAIARPAEPWSVQTADGLTIRGFYFPTAVADRLVIGVHGMGGNWGELADVARGLHDRGYAVLIFDFRGHGRSDWARLSMGRAERADLRAALAWARDQGYEPDRIGWLGYSMGASTILMEGVDNPDVRAVVLDSPYGDLPELLDAQLTLHSGLPPAFNPGIRLAAHRAFGVRTDDLVPIRRAVGWGRSRPILLIHGADDAIVPVAHARRLAAAIGPACELVVAPGVPHVGAYDDDPEGYLDRLDAFYSTALGTSRSGACVGPAAP